MPGNPGRKVAIAVHCPQCGGKEETRVFIRAVSQMGGEDQNLNISVEAVNNQWVPHTCPKEA